MQRRNLLFNLAAFGLAAPRLSTWKFLLPESAEPTLKFEPTQLAIPTRQQQAWQDLELGMFIHFAPNTWQDEESDNLSTPLSAINPAKLDTDQWVDTALALGARYIVFVTKHQGGFCMWQTRTTDYSIRNTPWKGGKGDVLEEIATSCRRRKIPLGVYVSPRDDHFGAGDGGACKTPELQAKYNALYRQQLTEVFSRYGELVEIWFDGSTVTPVRNIIRRYQPNAMVFQGPAATIRWVGNEDGLAPYPCWNGVSAAKARTGTSTSRDGDANGTVWLPNEVDVSIRRPDWFWSRANANKVLTVDQLLSVYYRSVGRGAQLLLNIPANRDGLPAAAGLRSGCILWKRAAPPLWTSARCIARSGRNTFTLALDQPTHIDTVVLQEEIARRRTSARLSTGRTIKCKLEPARGRLRHWSQANSASEASGVQCTSASDNKVCRCGLSSAALLLSAQKRSLPKIGMHSHMLDASQCAL